MCHEYWMRRRARDLQERETREIWLDFERSAPIPEPVPEAEPSEPTRFEAPDEAVTAER